MKTKVYFNCPNCGEDVPLKALACKHCGSDISTGWSTDSNEGLLDEEFYYEATKNKEFESQKFIFPNWIAITGFCLVFIFIIFLII